MTTGPETKCVAIGQNRILSAVEHSHQNHESLEVCISEPDPELCHIKSGIFHSDAVVNWLLHEFVTLKLEVEKCVPNVMKTRESHVVNLIDPLLIHCLSGEHAKVAKHVLDHDVEDIFVEHE